MYHFYLSLFSSILDVKVDNIDNFDIGVGKLRAGNYKNLKLQKKHIDCSQLFGSDIHNLYAPSFMTKPPKAIPKIWTKEFTYDGRVVTKSRYISDGFPANRTNGKLLTFQSYNIWSCTDK